MSQSAPVYELRTVRSNRPVYVFDNVLRAKEERERAASRGVPLTLVRVTRQEMVVE